jgi:hypothetical protein
LVISEWWCNQKSEPFGALRRNYHSPFTITNPPQRAALTSRDAANKLIEVKKSGGAKWAERVAAATDPLNLMRVMPPQGARSFEAMRSRAWLFCSTTNGHKFSRMEKGGTADYLDVAQVQPKF